MGAGLTFGKFVDERDGKEYKTVKIGNQTWLAENLNYAGTNGDIGKCYDFSNKDCSNEDFYYDNDFSNSENYGRLYSWKEAMEVCPAGWHLPSCEEWDELAIYVGGVELVKDVVFFETAGKKLKSKTGWMINGNGTDDYGFSALPGGLRFGSARFKYVGVFGYWWSATEINVERAMAMTMYYAFDVIAKNDVGKWGLLSVRCVAD